MPPKKSKLNAALYTKNTPKISDLFSKMQSKDSKLTKCTHCGQELKSCMIQDHKETTCTKQQQEKQQSVESNQDIIVIKVTQSASKKLKIEKTGDMTQNCTPTKIFSSKENNIKPLSPFSIFKSNEESALYVKREPKNEPQEILPPAKRKLTLGNEEPACVTNEALLNTNKKSDQTQKTPSLENLNYSLNNFCGIIDTVLNDNIFPLVLNESDREIIEKFRNLNYNCKILYVRLFQRKFQWINESNMNYENIDVDLTTLLSELSDQGFLIDESTVNTYEEILLLLKLPQLKQLQRQLKIQTNATTRKEIIKCLVEQSINQRGLSFTKATTHNNREYYIKEAKSLLGKCFKLQDSYRQVFVRILMLYSLSSTHHMDQNSIDSGQQSLIQIIMVNMGKVRYMNYSVDVNLNIFPNRESFLKYQEALQEEFELLELLHNKEYNEAFEVYEKKVAQFITHLELCPLKDEHAKLPTYLRKFSSNSIYCKIISIYASEVLERLKEYEKANKLFEFLVFEQSTYLLDSRARWYERLALNYESHLKNPIKAIHTLEKALMDKQYVRKAGRLNLYQRVIKMTSVKKYQKIKEIKKNLESLVNSEPYEIVEAPTVLIEGNILQPEIIPGRKVIFMQNSGQNAGNICSVEQMAMSHYINNLNYTHGKHAETSTMHTLFGIFLWDVLFEQVPNVFVDRFQSTPLDLQTDYFYTNRKQSIDARIAQIRHESMDILIEILSKTWNTYLGTSGLVNWDLFESCDELCSLVRCFSNEQLANLCEYMAKNYRYCRSGGPDLIMWSVESMQAIFVEVKGPGDRLSHKQLIWLDFFIQNSFKCEVCYVKSSHSKRLRN